MKLPMHINFENFYQFTDNPYINRYRALSTLAKRGGQGDVERDVESNFSVVCRVICEETGVMVNSPCDF